MIFRKLKPILSIKMSDKNRGWFRLGTSETGSETFGKAGTWSSGTPKYFSLHSYHDKTCHIICGHIIRNILYVAKELKFSLLKSCTCNDGFLVDGSGSCQDIDECVFIRQFIGRQMMRSLGFSTASCTANSECVNTVGSYFCRCLPGYESIENPFGNTCESIECNEGYQVNLTNNQCENINECEERWHSVAKYQY